MLGFLIFLSWLIIGGSPLVKAIWNYFHDEDVTTTRWVLNVLWAIGFGVIILIALWALDLWTEVMWFQELKFSSVFWTIYVTKWVYFIIPAIGASLLIWINLRFTRIGMTDDMRRLIDKSWFAYTVISGASALIAILAIGLPISSHWDKILLYAHQVPFGVNDPIFGADLGFYIFSLPIYQLLFQVFLGIGALAIAGTIIAYLVQYNAVFVLGSVKEREMFQKLRYRAITHISLLGILLMGIFIFGTKLAIWNVMYSTRGAVFGAGYTDVNVQIPAYHFFMVALVISAVALFISAIARSIRATEWLAGFGFGVCFLTWLVGVIIYPAIVQHFSVTPNELARETTYIKYNIAYTRQAYGLTGENVSSSEFPIKTDIDAGIVTRDRATLENVRLWDWRVLQATNSQNQAFRLYYSFPDVDVVRYRINGKLVQLMYSSRELDQDKLAEQSKTWLNQRMVYTHGFGGCANPVNTFVMPEGLPDYWIKDIPAVSRFPELQLTQPRIYYGEKSNADVYVKTKAAEFDFPQGNRNATCFYQGTGGVPIGSGLRKLALAMRFDGLRMYMANELTAESRVMFRRNLEDRIKTIAPFLRYDHDPYQVVVKGRLWFIWDAYTTSDKYPYSEPYVDESNEASDEGGFNYIRNSVKVVTDAYNGKVTFYVFDARDPLIKAYQRIFPSLFKPATAMPEELRVHVRYPEDLIRIQGEIYALYHMDNPTVFYNKEDAWEIAKESSHGDVKPIIPYYVVMTIPGEKEDEFVQMLPFTPLTTDKEHPRNNLVGWLAGRCDGANYGKLILYEFPKGQLIYGPLQIGIRIQQDETISKDMTLWNQQGSKVIAGNLLVIPLSDYRLMYLQPLYLQADVGKMPELKRVVLACGTGKLAYAATFEEALKQLVGKGLTGLSEPTPVKGKPVASSTESLIKEAARHLENYQRLTGEGKFGEAGREIDQLTQILNQLLKGKGR